MATNTEKIVVQVVVQGDKQLDKLSNNSKKATKNVGSLSKSLGVMTLGLVSASAAFNKINQVLSNAVKTFTKFEFEMAKVKAITGATDRDFKKLTNTAQQLGRSTFFTASQVAELQVNFGKLGFSTTEILDAQEATLMLATATQSDLGRAAIVAGAAVRGFALDAEETQRVVDVMAVAFTSSALDIEKFQTSMTKVAPIAAGANVTLESTTAVMGTLTDAGIEASIAGTSLRNIFLKMQDPASELSQKLGFTVNSSADLEKALIQLNSEGLSNAEMMELVDLRQVAAFQTMINGTHSILDLTDALEDANGEAQKMADIMANTLQGDILKAKSAWEGFELAILTGKNNISGYLRDIVQSWTQFISTVVDDLQTPEQRGSEFLKESLNTIRETRAEMDKMSGTTETNVNKKSRGAVILDEIDRIKKLNFVRLEQVEILKEEGRLRDKPDIKILEENIEARKFALKELNIILDEELKNDTAKRKKASMDKFIEDEKAKRAREKKRKEEKLEEEKQAREAAQLRRQELSDSEKELKIALETKINSEKENLKNEVITKEVFDARAFEAEQKHLQRMKELKISYGEDVTMINGLILDSELNRIRVIGESEAKSAADRKKEREGQISDLDSLGKTLITIAVEEEKLQAIRKLGVKVTAAATLATNLDTLANARNAIAKAATEKFPASLIAIVSVLAALLSATKQVNTIFGGGDMFANGGMVQGKSHAQGGEKFAVGGRVVELEGGEAVINKRSTAMFRNQLSAMNSAGGGVKFADGGLLNMPSFTQQQFNALGQTQMMGAMEGGRKVVVVEADITNAQDKVSVIESQATL